MWFIHHIYITFASLLHHFYITYVVHRYSNCGTHIRWENNLCGIFYRPSSFNFKIFKVILIVKHGISFAKNLHSMELEWTWNVNHNMVKTSKSYIIVFQRNNQISVLEYTSLLKNSFGWVNVLQKHKLSCNLQLK